jgi:protein-S-isoprenylcysteine O-methyltransferase Ste14
VSRAAGADGAPGTPFPPPLALVVAVAAMWVAHRWWHWPVPVAPRPRRDGGVALVVAGAALAIWAVQALRAARTHPEPWKPTATIVAAGPFAWSRNPIYLAFLVCAAGAAWWIGTWWGVPAVGALFAFYDRAQVAREERYLVARFGAEYEHYRARVRRWI